MWPFASFGSNGLPIATRIDNYSIYLKAKATLHKTNMAGWFVRWHL
jgi:hypothetical protein